MEQILTTIQALFAAFAQDSDRQATSGNDAAGSRARKAISIELNTEYYKDGLFYVKAINSKLTMPALFDMEEEE